MTRRVSAGINAIIGRWLPEQRVFAKSDDRTRFVRLSPLSQLAGATCLTALIGWTGYLTAERLSGADLGARLVATDARIVTIYDARIERLEDERRRLEGLLADSQAQVAQAAATAAASHQSLGEALTQAKALKATKIAHQGQLAELAALQFATLNRCDALDAELASIAAKGTSVKRQLTASDAALSDLAAALAETAEDRDQAQRAASRLSIEVASLQSEFDLRRDQQKRLMSRLEDAARLSLGSLETVFSKTGVDLDKVLAEVRRDYTGSGGLFIPLPEGAGFADEPEAGDASVEADRIASLLSDMERVNSMRLAIERLPLRRPVGAARFTSSFGARKDPINGQKSFHAGVDYAGPRGTAIYAAGAGEVVYSARQRGYGNLIKIRHAFGYETVYAHLNRRRVKVGDKVERGDRIGDMGNTGRSTGTHLHYEIRVNGKTVNPAKYIEAARNVL